MGDCGAAQPMFCYNCGYLVGYKLCYASPPPPPPLLAAQNDDVLGPPEEEADAPASTAASSASRATLLVAARGTRNQSRRTGARNISTPQVARRARLA